MDTLLIKQTSSTSWEVKDNDNKIRTYIKFGIGIIPTYENPNFEYDFYIRRSIKNNIFGVETMNERLRFIGNYKLG